MGCTTDLANTETGILYFDRRKIIFKTLCLILPVCQIQKYRLLVYGIDIEWHFVDSKFHLNTNAYVRLSINDLLQKCLNSKKIFLSVKRNKVLKICVYNPPIIEPFIVSMMKGYVLLCISIKRNPMIKRWLNQLIPNWPHYISNWTNLLDESCKIVRSKWKQIRLT